MIVATDCLLTLGRRGCGKTFLNKRLQQLWPRRVVLDQLGEYGPEDGQVVFGFDEFTTAIAKLERDKPEKFVLIVHFDPQSTVSEDEFNEILKLCYFFGNLQVVIEEVQLYTTAHQLPHWFRQCLLTGRHRGLSILASTQRPGELHKTILSQCVHIFCGQIFEGNDIRYVTSFLGTSSDRLSSLPPRKFLYFFEGKITEIQNDAI